MAPRKAPPKPGLRITDTTLRDGNQSLFGGALTNDELAALAARLDGLGFAALEAFGGGTYEVALRRGEDPWEGLRRLVAATPKTPIQALVRGQNLVASRSFADDTVELWVKVAAELGVEIFRVFDALNDVRNLEVPIAAAKRAGARVQGALAYTVSPVHDLALWRELAGRLRDLGVDDLVVKDTGGLLTPQAARELVPALAEAAGLPVVVHSHCSGGLAPFSYLASIEAGAAGVDTALSTFGWGASQPGVEALVTVLEGGPHDIGLDLGALTSLRDELEAVRAAHVDDLIPFADRADAQLLHYAVPRSLLHQVTETLDEHNARDRFDDVLGEVASVREDLGYPPLLAPVRELVAAQAVYNVLGGARYETVTQELKDYLQGLYGAPPKPVDVAIRRLVLAQSDPVTVRPADLLVPQVEPARALLAGEVREAAEEAGAAPVEVSDGDVLHAILFPELAAELRGSVRAQAALAADAAVEREVAEIAEG
ncbi:MAG: pyruvate carboxylase subunit B, partial [Candidatus Dormiibacterota bacterium]